MKLKLPDGSYFKFCPQEDSARTEYTDEELVFMKAFDRYKRENRRPFPTCRELLAVVVALGYRKVETHEPQNQHEDATNPDSGLRGRCAVLEGRDRPLSYGPETTEVRIQDIPPDFE